MPVSPTYPGVYVNELPNPVMPIVGVPTSVTAFVGPATMGQTDYPVQCNSWSDYENTFGSLDPTVPLSYAVYMF
ncbi:MAG: phage tail sheath family protein, partial [Solirubrobacteraceae bacterium]